MTEQQEYTPGPNAVDITPNKDGGVFKEIIKEGEGDARPFIGSTVIVHYHGTLTDGTVFDSSKESGNPFEFTLGIGNVILGWDVGVATMRKGEIAVLTCKPDYAYGKGGKPPKIPPESTLIFEVTLIDWKLEDISPEKDGSILRGLLEKGKFYSTPDDGSLVDVHIVGEYNNRVFDDRSLRFNIGQGCEEGVIEGIEIALQHFNVNEKSRLKIKPKYAFKEEGHEEFGIPPNATVTYTVHLKDFEKAHTWDMSGAEKLSSAKLLKEKATKHLKDGKYALAIRLYNNLMKYIDSEADFSGDGEAAERESLLLAVQLNLGLAYLKANQNYEAKEECNKALKIDPNNIKGLFRRGQAYLNINEPESAKADFEAVVRLEPTNKLAASQIIVCCNKIKQHREKEKKIYANMFDKFAQKDKEKEELTKKEEPDTMEVLGEWGKDERDREPTEFEQENPDILMLNKNDEFKNM